MLPNSAKKSAKETEETEDSKEIEEQTINQIFQVLPHHVL